MLGIGQRARVNDRRAMSGGRYFYDRQGGLLQHAIQAVAHTHAQDNTYCAWPRESQASSVGFVKGRVRTWHRLCRFVDSAGGPREVPLRYTAPIGTQSNATNLRCKQSGSLTLTRSLWYADSCATAGVRTLMSAPQ